MVDRRDLGSWMEGPGATAGDVPQVEGHWGRRLAALLVDWLVAVVIATGVLGIDPGDGTSTASALAPLGVFALMTWVLVGTLGSTLGHRLLGLRVVRQDGGWAGPGRAALRTALLVLVLPAVLRDPAGRGLHDRAAGTDVVRL